MNTHISNDQVLSDIEKLLRAELDGKEFWGDLDISVDETDILSSKLKDTLAKPGITIQYICDAYPRTLTTWMVFFVRYKYNANFWGDVFSQLGIVQSQKLCECIGSCTRNMFKRYNMDCSDVKDEVRVNLAPIIYEACLPPESSLDDLFYVLSYDRYSIFDPEMIIDEMIDMRSYIIRKPLLRFFTRFRNSRAVDFLLEVRDAMISTDQGMPLDSRYSINYSQWKEEIKSKGSKHKSQEFQTKPYLVFENGSKGLCILLPRVMLDSEWVAEITWTIKGTEGFSRTVNCNVVGDQGIRYTEAMLIPVSPQEQYSVSMDDSEELFSKNNNRKWDIKGVAADSILLFNNNGRQTSSNYIPSPYGIIIIPDSVSIDGTRNLDIANQYYPTDISGYRIASITPTGNDALLKYSSDGKTSTVILKPQFNMELSGKTLFDLESSGVDTALYTGIPMLRLSCDNLAIMKGLELRIGKTRYPIDAKEDSIDIDLKKIAKKEFGSYGTYSIRLYQLDKFIKQVEFSLLPVIKTDYYPNLDWPKADERKEPKQFKFQKLDDWEMDFEDCIVYENNSWYQVKCEAGKSLLHAVLRSVSGETSFKIDIDLPIRPFEIEMVGSDGLPIENLTDKTHRVGVQDFLTDTKWLSARFFGNAGNKSYYISIKSVDGKKQKQEIKISQNGSGNINLSSFYDTIRNCPLPAEVVLECDEADTEDIPLIVLTEKYSMNKPVKIQLGENSDHFVINIADEGKDLDIVRFGHPAKSYYLLAENSRLGKSGMTRGYRTPERLTEGLYIVSGSKKQTDFEFEEEEMEFDSGSSICLASRRKKDSNEVCSVSEWLDLLISDIVTTDQVTDIKDKRSYWYIADPARFADLSREEYDSLDIEKLAALGYLAGMKISAAKKGSILTCMRFISANLLHRGDRCRITDLLVKMRCPTSVFDICMREYSLLLFDELTVDAKTLAHELEPYSEELSMLVLMSEDGPIRDCIWKEKYRDLIGRDAIKKLLDVRGETDPQVIAEEQKKFLKEQKGSKVTISLDDEISGNQEAIQGMITYDNKYNVFFNIKNKPDYGVYFCHSKYVDQYVNWYMNTHDRSGSMNPEKNEIKNRIVKEYADRIKKAMEFLSNDKELWVMTKQYHAAISCRCRDGVPSYMKNVTYPVYFYFQGLAAYLSKLPKDRKDLDKFRDLGIKFMSAASVVAPRLAQRDIVMVGTYIYLKRKEAALCR